MYNVSIHHNFSSIGNIFGPMFFQEMYNFPFYRTLSPLKLVFFLKLILKNNLDKHFCRVCEKYDVRLTQFSLLLREVAKKLHALGVDTDWEEPILWSFLAEATLTSSAL